LAVGFSFVYVGTFRILNMDELLGVMVGSMVYALIIEGPRRETRTQLQETVDLLFSSLAFVFFGILLPWNSFGSTIGAARGVVLVIGILLLRRLPFILGLKSTLKPQIRTNMEASFVGFFGPIGISALFYSAFAVNQTGDQKTWHVVSFIVFVSVVAFGLTDTMLTKLYGKLANKQKQTELKQKQEERAQDETDADVLRIEREIHRREERMLKKGSVEMLFIPPSDDTIPNILEPSNLSDYSKIAMESISIASPSPPLVQEEKLFEQSEIEQSQPVETHVEPPVAVIFHPELGTATTPTITREKETQTQLLREAEKDN